jgi:hypothetical protein
MTSGLRGTATRRRRSRLARTRRVRRHNIIRRPWRGTLMRHVLLPGAPATRPYRMGQPTATARLVALTGRAPGVISRRLCTPAGAINLAAVAAAADQHLSAATRTHEQPGWRFHRRRLARTWTALAMLGIMPRHACSARCGARRRSGTWRFRSAPCLPIGRLSPRQSASDARRHAARHAHACGYVDNARALPTYPQAQQSTTSIQFDSSERPALRPSPSYPGPQAGQP